MQFSNQIPELVLILLDLPLPARDGFAVLADLRKCHPSIAVVVIPAHHDRDNVVRALDLGAVGFIPKSATRQVILGALQLVFSGGIYIPPQALSRPEPPPAAPQPAAPGGAHAGQPERPAASPADLGLTARQVDVPPLLIHGKHTSTTPPPPTPPHPTAN